MPRTDVSPTTLTQNGVFPAAVAGTADGNMFRNNGDVFLEVANANGTTARTVTLPTPAQREGLAIADLVVSVAAASRTYIGPFSPSLFNNQTGADAGKAYINFDAAAPADLSIRAFKFPSL